MKSEPWLEKTASIEEKKGKKKKIYSPRGPGYDREPWQ